MELQRMGEMLVVSSSTSTTSHDNSTTNQIEEALNLAQVWRLRCGDRLPHAVESTIALSQSLWRLKQMDNNTHYYQSDEGTTAKRHDHRSDDMGNLLGMSEIRYALATAVIRSINGLADVLQQQRREATSISILCKHLGIPSWLVDIRHDATHNKVPPLPMLEIAASTVLQYFRQVYWDKLREHTHKQRQKCLDLLEQYREANKSVEEQKWSDTKVSTVVETRISDKIPSIYEDEDDEDDFQVASGNRFAALAETKPKPKKRKSPPKPKELPKAKEPKKSFQEETKPIVRKIIEENLPPSLMYSTLHKFLIYGYRNDEIGYLFDNEMGFEKCVERNKTLIFTYAREQPGFLSSLVTHLVDFVIQGPPGNLVQSQKCSIQSVRWVEKLMSCDFLVEWSNALSKEVGGAGQFASARVLCDILQYPLFSLRQRCKEYPKNTSCRSLTESFEAVLGLDLMKSISPASETTSIEQLGSSTTATELMPSSEEVSSLGTKPKKCIWQRCERWEPCAIGSLPGLP